MKTTFLASLAGFAGFAACTSARRAPVVMISVDGLVPGDVLSAQDRGQTFVAFNRLLAEGAHARGARGIFPTITGPGHTTLITGVVPAVHGIPANDRMEAYQKKAPIGFNFAEEIAARTLFDAAYEAGLVTASVGWPISAGARVTFNVTHVNAGDRLDGAKLDRALMTSGLPAELAVASGGRPYVASYDLQGDEVRATYAAHILTTRRPDFTAVYFSALDGAQHTAGPHTPAAYAMLSEIDLLIARVSDAAERTAEGHAVICVVSDHGFAAVEREVRINVALRDASLLATDGEGRVTSWRAYAWSAAGSAAIMLADPGDLEARDRAKVLLDGLAASPDSGVERVIDGGQGIASGGFPGAAFVIGARRGFVFSTRIEGSTLVVPSDSKGMHGYLPDDPAMDSSLFCRGPGVPAGRDLGRIEILDVAPTIAGLLGVSLPSAAGRDLFAIGM